MRKMQEYFVKGNRIFVGLEDSKSTWKVCVRCDKMIVNETTMPAEYRKLREYLANRFPDCKITVMYEAGFQGFWLHDLLVEDGIGCVVTPPNKVSQPKDERVKTDKRDARRLAMNLENGDYIRCHVPDAERREDRQLSRTLIQMQKHIVSIKNQIRKFLDFHGLMRDKAGSWQDRDYLELGELGLPPSLKISLDCYLHMLQELLAMKKKLTGELKKLCAKDRYKAGVQAKMSAPGIGWFTAIRLTLEWGDMTRFETGKQLAKFTGLTCREYSTGDTVRKGRITGQSNKHVRSWLIECAWRAYRKDPVLYDKFRKVTHNSGSKKKAIVAVARKLAVRLWAVETSGQKYCLGVVS